MRWMVSLCFVLALALGVGCASQKKVSKESPATEGPGPSTVQPAQATAPAAPIVTPNPIAQGTVALANAQARYVIVRFPIGTVPAAGQRLNVYRGGLKVGEISITGPQRDFNIAADIVQGECKVGDEVRGN